MTNDLGKLINDEAQMTDDEGMTKSKFQKPGGKTKAAREKANKRHLLRHSSFVIRSCFDIRHSSF
jgi:hypothetical protein